MNFEDKLNAGLTRDFLDIMYSIGAPKAVIEKEIDAEPTVNAVYVCGIFCAYFAVWTVQLLRVALMQFIEILMKLYNKKLSTVNKKTTLIAIFIT